MCRDGRLKAIKPDRKWCIDPLSIQSRKSDSDDRDRLNLILSHMQIPHPTAVPGKLDLFGNVPGSYEDQVGDVKVRWTVKENGRLVLWTDQETEDWLGHHYPDAYTDWVKIQRSAQAYIEMTAQYNYFVGEGGFGKPPIEWIISPPQGAPIPGEADAISEARELINEYRSLLYRVTKLGERFGATMQGDVATS